MIRLDHYDTLPESLAGISPTEIRQIFPNPSLIFLEGRRKDPLFLSTVLHGHETTSFFVLQELVHHLRGHPLPRSMIIFVGNVRACEGNMRFLPDQQDWNRIWAGGHTDEHKLASSVIETASRHKLFASIDIHNNTGLNPQYACVNHLEQDYLHLASMFSRPVIYYATPPTTQSIAFSKLCPAVTLECGQPGNPAGTKRAFEYVIDVLHKEELPKQGRLAQEIEIYQTVGRVTVPPDVKINFGTAEADANFPEDLEFMNFREMPVDFVWAKTQGNRIPMKVSDEKGQDLTSHYFYQDGNYIRTKRPVFPSMITTNETIIRQDCLAYLMERRPVPLTAGKIPTPEIA